MVLPWLLHTTKRHLFSIAPINLKILAQKVENGVSIFHDYARPNIAQPVVDLFIDYAWETLRHPTYRPDLSPLDFEPFPKLVEPFPRLLLEVWVSFHYFWPRKFAISIRKTPEWDLNASRPLAGVYRTRGGLYRRAVNFISHNNKWFLNPDYLCITFRTTLVFTWFHQN